MSKRIIIAEDHPVNMEDYIAFVKGKAPDAEIEATEDGKTLVYKVKEHGCDFVMTDVRLKGMSGIDAARQIRGFNKEVPIVVISGYDYPQYKVAVEKIPRAYFMLKENYREELPPILQQYLR